MPLYVIERNFAEQLEVTKESADAVIAINIEDGLFGVFAKLRRGLFVSGFAVNDDAHVPPDDTDWVKPGNLLSLMDTPGFKKKL